MTSTSSRSSRNQLHPYQWLFPLRWCRISGVNWIQWSPRASCECITPKSRAYECRLRGCVLCQLAVAVAVAGTPIATLPQRRSNPAVCHLLLFINWWFFIHFWIKCLIDISICALHYLNRTINQTESVGQLKINSKRAKYVHTLRMHQQNIKHTQRTTENTLRTRTTTRATRRRDRAQVQTIKYYNKTHYQNNKQLMAFYWNQQ